MYKVLSEEGTVTMTTKEEDEQAKALLRSDIGEEYEKLSYGKKVAWGRELEANLKRMDEEKRAVDVEYMAGIFERVLIKHGII